MVLDLDAISRAPVVREPFTYFSASGVLSQAALRDIARDFPPIRQGGIFPLEQLETGAAFDALVDDIRSADLERTVGGMLGIDLASRPLMITVRGHCSRRDGRIHTDSEDKVATCLLYLNEPWAQGGGRLRLLRNGHDIDDYLAEIPPDGGTLVAFRRSDTSWHGHLPFEGPRRYVMFNWVRSGAALSRHVRRHHLSASLKRLNPFH